MQARILGKRKDGSLKVRFRYWEDGELKTVPQKKVRKLYKEDDVEPERLLLEARYDAKKLEREHRESWRDKYYDFEQLEEEYRKYRKEEAPNSWKQKVFDFKYVLHYFLNIKKSPNLDDWRRHFKPFKTWLEVRCRSVKTGKKLSYGTLNHIIVELNWFLHCMAELGHCDPPPKLKHFPKHKTDRFLGDKALVSEKEFIEIKSILEKMNPRMALFYELLRDSGMRLNEAWSLTYDDIVPGKMEYEPLAKELERCGLEYEAFIILSRQLGDNDQPEPDWKPLKQRYEICEENNRYIPICSPELHDRLVDYFEEEGVGFLFRGYFSKNVFRNTLVKAYAQTKHFYKHPHCLRHTRANELAGIAGFSMTLNKLILGHGEKTLERYLHLNKSIERRIVRKNKEKTFKKRNR